MDKRGVDLARGFVGGLVLNLEQGGIPDVQTLQRLLKLYELRLSGKKFPPLHVINRVYSNMHFQGEVDYSLFNPLGENVELGIRGAFSLERTKVREAERYLKSHTFLPDNSSSQRKYWFRDNNQKEKTRIMMGELFDQREIEAINTMGQVLAPYKRRFFY